MSNDSARKSKLKESRCQSWLAKQFKACGAVVFNVHGHAMQASGWPDLQVYHRAWSGHIELKMAPKRVELGKLQDHRLRELNERGTNALWIQFEQTGLLRVFTLVNDEWTERVCPFTRTGDRQRIGMEILRFLVMLDVH